MRAAGPEEDSTGGLAGLSHLFLSRSRERAISGAVPRPEPCHEPLFVSGGTDALLPAYAALRIAEEWSRRGERPVLVDADPNLPLLRLLREIPAIAGAAGDSPPWAASVSEARAGAWSRILACVPSRMLLPPSAPAGVTRLLLVLSPERAEAARAYAAIKRVLALNGQPWVGIAWRTALCARDQEAAIRAFHRFLRRHAGCAAVDCGRVVSASTKETAIWAAEIAGAVDQPDPEAGPDAALGGCPDSGLTDRESAEIRSIFDQPPSGELVLDRKNFAP